jgi:hypothetical protein
MPTHTGFHQRQGLCLILNPKTGKSQTFHIRRFFFSMHPPGRPTAVMFLAVEPDRARSGHNIVFTKMHKDACKAMIQGFPRYLMKDYGENAAFPGAGEDLLRLLTDYGQERYLQLDWDDINKRVISIRERHMQESVAGMELDWADWLMPAEATGDVVSNTSDQVMGKRPLPMESREDYDDKSCQTTGTNLTIKANLREVTLGEVPDAEAGAVQAQLTQQRVAQESIDKGAAEAQAAIDAAAAAAAAEAALQAQRERARLAAEMRLRQELEKRKKTNLITRLRTAAASSSAADLAAARPPQLATNPNNNNTMSDLQQNDTSQHLDTSIIMSTTTNSSVDEQMPVMDSSNIDSSSDTSNQDHPHGLASHQADMSLHSTGDAEDSFFSPPDPDAHQVDLSHSLQDEHHYEEDGGNAPSRSSTAAPGTATGSLG